MQSTASRTLTLKVHRAAYLHVCIVVKIILHEIHTQRVLLSLGEVDYSWMRVNRNASIVIVPIRKKRPLE